MFARKFDIIDICLKKEKVNKGGIWTFGPYSNNISDWLKLCELSNDPFIKIKKAFDGYSLWRQVLTFLIIKQTLATQSYSSFTNLNEVKKRFLDDLLKKDYDNILVIKNTIDEILKTELEIVLTNIEFVSVLFWENKIDKEKLKREIIKKSLISFKNTAQKEINRRENILIDKHRVIDDIDKCYNQDSKVFSTIHNLIELKLFQDCKLSAHKYNGFKKEYEKKYFLLNEKNIGFHISFDIFEYNNKIIGKYLFTQLFNNKKLKTINIEEMKELFHNTDERYVLLTNYHYTFTKEIEKDLRFPANEEEIHFLGVHKLNSHLNVCLIHNAQLNIQNSKSLILINDKILFSRIRRDDEYISINEQDKKIAVNLNENIKIKKLPDFVAYRII